MNTVRFDEALNYYDKIFNEEKSVSVNLIDNKIGGYFGARGLSEIYTYSPLISNYVKKVLDDKIISHPPFMDDFISLIKADNAEMIFPISKRDHEGDAIKCKLDIPHITIEYKGGDFISQKYLSFGQKRLLSLVIYLYLSYDIIIADELVNGLHHKWI